MQRKSIESSQIRSIGYDPATETLEVEFRGGEVWQYYHFPEYMWLEFESAQSQGKYFNQQIRERFTPFGARVN